jgi:hypothetical protein
MDKARELELADLTAADYEARVADAIDAASDQDQPTWLTENGKRIAAIVPVDVLEQHDAWLRNMMTGDLSQLAVGARRPWVRGYDDAMNGKPEDPGELESIDALKYHAGYGIGTLDKARDAERRS